MCRGMSRCNQASPPSLAWRLSLFGTDPTRVPPGRRSSAARPRPTSGREMLQDVPHGDGVEGSMHLGAHGVAHHDGDAVLATRYLARLGSTRCRPRPSPRPWQHPGSDHARCPCRAAADGQAAQLAHPDGVVEPVAELDEVWPWPARFVEPRADRAPQASSPSGGSMSRPEARSQRQVTIW